MVTCLVLYLFTQTCQVILLFQVKALNPCEAAYRVPTEVSVCDHASQLNKAPRTVADLTSIKQPQGSPTLENSALKGSNRGQETAALLREGHMTSNVFFMYNLNQPLIYRFSLFH